MDVPPVLQPIPFCHPWHTCEYCGNRPWRVNRPWLGNDDLWKQWACQECYSAFISSDLR